MISNAPEQVYEDRVAGEVQTETEPVRVVVVRKGRVLRRELHPPRFDTTLAVNPAMLGAGGNR